MDSTRRSTPSPDSRTPAPRALPVVLTIAGSDPSAGAGIQADLKAISANGGYGASVITAITAQNTRAVTAAAEVGLDLIRAQIAAVFEDLDVRAVKSGMLASRGVIEVVADELGRRRPRHYVLDPVMVSKTGFPLLEPEAVDALRRNLLPRATLVTPNTHEAEALAGFPVATLADAERAGRAIVEAGAPAALVKGGHLQDRPGTDVLVTAAGVEVIAGEHLAARHTHGTGCTYSAAIATWLARGLPLAAAVTRAKAYITEAIRGGLPIGHGVGPTDHFFFLGEPDGGRWLAELRATGTPADA
jgi:hydroxymethylpyrimidine/phosphomethylpyrimidine kinase